MNKRGRLLDYMLDYMPGLEFQVMKVYRRFLRALLGVSGETVRELRMSDPLNRIHMSHFPQRVQDLWQVSRARCTVC